MLEAWTEAKYDEGEVLFLCHCTVVSSDIVELSASLRFATVANGCLRGAYSKRHGVKDAALMKIEVLV
jgi:hypothetical protein